MAGFGDLLQRIVRDLEEAGAQRPADDLRARLGYGTGDDPDDDDDLDNVDDRDEPAPDTPEEPVWEPVTARKRGATREPEAARKPGAAWEPEAVWRPASARKPEASRAPAPATLRAFETHRAPSSPAAPPHLQASPASLRSERIRARLRAPNTLREAFVVKEILDRPLGLRRTRRTR